VFARVRTRHAESVRHKEIETLRKDYGPP